ncbi:deoxyribose-phosphate aldolase [Canibacter sp. lx-45]|uniref:deoxyribose-phosphate aldolase n=1 Tax=Canibacter zhuwentaonis TaxID=2837491 RepID=UPI001BDC3F1B|nr:deoxyribose-phosphate aldolase [Canibacter zhuwentaonis]
MENTQLAKYLDATLLQPEATASDVAALIATAEELGCYAVCVSPSMLPLACELPAALKLATVVGFPSGKHAPKIKAAEAARAVAAGADEIDMVIDLGSVFAGDYAAIVREIALVRASAPAPVVLKVIIEAAALSDEQIIMACEAAIAGGADFVKTSTGFHPAGGASVHAVRLLAQTVGGELGVKASGGICDRSTALEMIAAGATRLGVSAAADILR